MDMKFKLALMPQVASYRERGIVRTLHVLPKTKAAVLSGRYLANAAAIKGRNNQKPHLLYTWLRALVRGPRILDSVENVLGPNLLCWRAQFFADRIAVMRQGRVVADAPTAELTDARVRSLMGGSL